MKNKKTLIWLLGVLIIFAVVVFSFSTVYAAEGDGVVIPTGTGLSGATVKDILTALLNWLLEIVGIIAIIGFVVSGIQYIVSTGNDKMMESAKKNMMYSLIGITVALAAYVIIKAIDSILKATIGT